jgi:PTS system nitrogen regulatory IIA component
MKLVDVLRAECIVAAATPVDKKAALRAVVSSAKCSPILSEITEDSILKEIEAREGLGSTGFGKGIAIPHCRLEGISDFIVGILTVPEGVDFDALDGEPVNLIVFIIAPATATNEHIKLLSAISQALQAPGAVKEMLAETSSEAVMESFLRHTRADLDTKDRGGKNMIHVFVQDEALFRDLVEVLTSTESSSVVIQEAENTGAYLAKMPLFAGFWRDEASGFCQLIIAVIDKKLTNVAVRAIEGITGDLDKVTGVMVVVQEVYYCAGNLGVQS